MNGIRWSLKKREALWGAIFVSPWLVGVAVLVAWPLGRTILLSFQRVTLLTGLQAEWAGLANYVDVMSRDVEFIPALIGTVTDFVINAPVVIVFSLGMALLLVPIVRGQYFLRAIFFLPVIIGSASVIKEMLSMGTGEEMMASTLKSLQTVLGATQAQTQVARPAAYDLDVVTHAMGFIAPIQVVLDRLALIIWHTGVQILLFVAGLNSIPPTLYEAAEVDGSTGWEAFWKITLPMLSPVILVAGIFTLVDALADPLNAVLDHVITVSLGGEASMGYGAAMGVIYFVVVFVLVLLFLRISSRMVFYAGERQ